MRRLLIPGLGLVAIAIALALPPIPQDTSYHDFADRREWLAIPNFLDVISNLPFVLTGILGLSFLWRRRKNGGIFVESSEQWPYVVLFMGVALTGFGSAYYHLAPDNARLTWDRLPMTLIFTSFFAATIAERVSLKAGLRSLLPLVGLGIGSVVYWHLSELRGAGDLRPYILVQFYPLLTIPLLALLFPPRYTRSVDLLIIAAIYAAAKVFELLDAAIFSLGRIASGHTLKHLLAAAAACWILRMLQKRRPLNSTPASGDQPEGPEDDHR